MSKEIQKQITQIFQIDELLGSGAYGHVWKVKQKSTKQTYALKKVFDAFQNNIDAQRTYREITILHQLDHPGIVKLKCVIKAQNDKDLYLVFQHMQTDLHSLVGEDILELPHLTFIIYQIFKALKYIHSAQLLHRDLKPSNVLINSQCHIKLCDFGLVRSLTREESAQLILSEDVATRWYRSPQMLLGSHVYDWATDVWSVGCIIAQLIIGQPILMGGSNIEQLQKILQLTGIPKKQDITSIKSTVAESLINQFKILKKPFKHYFKGCKFQSQPQLINLVKSMLEFNPQKRITVEEVLSHSLFEQFRDEKQEILCRKMIIPQLDDNVRLSVDEYREFIYKDIQRRYPEYNNVKKEIQQVEEEENSGIAGRIGSIVRNSRGGYHSLMNRNSSISSLPRAKATNSLMRQVRNKNQHKTMIQSNQIKTIQHQSLHCNTAHTSNFYKAANLNNNSINHNSINHKQKYMGSLHRNNVFISTIQSKQKYQNNKQSTNVSTVMEKEKSPFRKYKKMKGKQQSQMVKIDKIQGLLYKDNSNSSSNNMVSKNNSQSKQKLTTTNTIPPKSLTDNNNNNVMSSKLYFYDPTSIYRPSPSKQLIKKQKNVYKIQQVTNNNKITKKTFTKFRKQSMNNLLNESSNKTSIMVTVNNNIDDSEDLVSSGEV